MKHVPLTKGYSAIVDDEDFVSVSRFSWSAKVYVRSDGTVKNVYAQRAARICGKKRTQTLHQFLLGPSPNAEIDHRNHDGLDCRRENLRVATHRQNRRNMKAHCDSASGYKGVSWKKDHKKWRAEIKFEGRNCFLGYFDTAQSAATAYDDAAMRLFGEFARLNSVREVCHRKI